MRSQSTLDGWHTDPAFELIAELYPAFVNGSGRKFHYAANLEAYARHAKRGEPSPQFYRLHILIESNDVDRKKHSKSMNAG